MKISETAYYVYFIGCQIGNQTIFNQNMVNTIF